MQIISQEPTEKGWHFTIEMDQSGDIYPFKVTLDSEYMEALSPGGNPEDLIRRVFKFLLAHEEPSEILMEFDVRDVIRYFPDFETVFKEGA